LEIEFADQVTQLLNKGSYFCYDLRNDRLLIGDWNGIQQDIAVIGITHETIHSVLRKLEGFLTSRQFDNPFGPIYFSAVLVYPENEFPWKIIRKVMKP